MGSSHSVTRLVLMLLFLINHQERTQTCSPPRSKFGDQTVKELSILKRSDKAEVIVLGSVVETYPDKYGQSMSARIAVHMVLKSKSRVKKYITVNGFDSDSKELKSKLFASQASVDCVNSIVELYGSYIFFIRQNLYGDYYVDEINLQSAVTDIPCKEELSRRVKRLIIKYRKEKNNRAQCNDFARSASNFSRKCLKHRSFSRLLNEFKYKQLPIRKFFCSVRRATASLKKTLPTEPTMRDDVRRRLPETVQNDVTRVKSKVSAKNNNNKSSFSTRNKKKTAAKRRGNFIMYSKSENYIMHENADVSDIATRHESVRINIPEWRFFNHHQSNSETTATSMSTNLIHVNLFVLCIALVTSLIYACS